MIHGGSPSPPTNKPECSSLEQELAASEQRLRLLIEQTPAAVAIVDRDLKYVHVSEQWRSSFGLPDDEQEVIGKSHYDLVPALPERWREVHQRSLRGAVERCDEDSFVRPDGSLEWVRWSVAPWRDGAGEIGGLILAIELLTDRKETDRALCASYEETKAAREEATAARRQAEAATRMKDQFLALLGHELRNPLAPILTALELMKIRDNDASVRERIIIERQVQHLVCLVDDLLDVSRITRGQLDLKKQPVETSQIIAQAVEMASPLLERRAHNLKVAIPRRGLLVDVDGARMAQVFANLLTNAAKYTEPGGQILVAARASGGKVSVHFSDSGCGIAPEMLPYLFDMFVQGERMLERSRGGLGIGLTIVRSLVELHGGTVTARSDGPGRGAEFIVSLPSVSQQMLDLESSPRMSSLSSECSRGRRVLVVDDNTDAAETLADILHELGHETSVAHDGPSALTKALVFRPDVALLDIGLPVMDGYELARRLREQPELRRVLLFAVTGYGQESDKERSRAAGFQEHLVKPIDLSRLRALIDRTPSASERPSVS